MKQCSLLLFLAFFSSFSIAQKLTAEEMKLYDLMMDYRKAYGLPSIPISKSLTTVARTHVKDLQDNKPDQDSCNAHSWSSKGSWSPCCYTPDHAQAPCMWGKPRELTSYRGDGFEIAVTKRDSFRNNLEISASLALERWKLSPGHNAVIINKGIWQDKHWKAIGICIGPGYAVAWFGEEPDK